MDIGALVILGITVASVIIKTLDENKKKSRPQVVAEPIFEQEEEEPAFSEPTFTQEAPATGHVQNPVHNAAKKAAAPAPEEPERKHEKIDARKLIVYSAIMQPKFEEKSF